MSTDQILLLTILVAMVALFVWGRWRHDMVAVTALLASVGAGLLPATEAFTGFGHPAVITVACVLILSSGLRSSGAVDALSRVILPQSAGPLVTVAALTGLAAILSAFVNNVGTLAILMPVALTIANRLRLPPGKVLMPLAFASILGGMMTLVGTPPNLIVSGFRAARDGHGFAMFDFTPVGAGVAAVGVLFVALFSRWLVPARVPPQAQAFEIEAYLAEARVPEKSRADGMVLREIEAVLEKADAQVIGLIQDEVRIPAPSPFRRVRRGDILVIEAEPEGLASALSALGLKLEADVQPAEARDDAQGQTVHDDQGPKAIQSNEIVLRELVVLPGSECVGRSASEMQIRDRYRINLLAVSRQGFRSTARLRTMAILVGDVMLMQGSGEALEDFAANFGCAPLAERTLRLPDRRRGLLAGAIMALAVAAAAAGLVPATISFAAGVLAAMATRVVSPRSVYAAIDWPVVVLLGALLPVSGALATTGTADLIARFLLEGVARGHPVAALALILIVTMTLSDFMNNAATAAVMCPIALGTADRLGASADAFLMAVAIGASCAFLTPIGHQNNTLILGRSGFGFGDYWRLGLPLEILIVLVGLPLLLLVWPL